MKEFFAKLFGWIYQKLFGESQGDKVYSEIWKIFEAKCKEFDKQVLIVEKMQEEAAEYRKVHRKLSEEYFECEKRRSEMAAEISKLKIRINQLELELSELNKKVKNA